MEPVQPVQMNIYQSNTHIKDLSQLLLVNEPKVQERQQVKGQQSCISTFVAHFQVAPRKDMTATFCARLYGRLIEIESNLSRKKLHRTNQGSNFFGRRFNNRHNVRAPIQFRRES